MKRQFLREHHNRQDKGYKPDYREEMKLVDQGRHREISGTFQTDSEFKAKHPKEFELARRNRDGIFGWMEDPLIFLRERDGDPWFVISPSSSVDDFADTYDLDANSKSTKQLFRRLSGHATIITAKLKDQIRHWPMRAFVNPPLPLQFEFCNSRGGAASVWVSVASVTFCCSLRSLIYERVKIPPRQ